MNRKFLGFDDVFCLFFSNINDIIGFCMFQMWKLIRLGDFIWNLSLYFYYVVSVNKSKFKGNFYMYKVM